jgi:catechol 2,3-dioxygenase-like lactoylglutathione lyase family enzyme
MSKPPKVTRVLETCFDVDNLDRSRKFYETLFGFPTIASGDRFCAFDVARKSVLLLFLRDSSLVPMPTAGGAIPPHGSHGSQHAAFSITEMELDAWRSRLAEAAVKIESEVKWARGGTSLYFRDPDGNLLELATPGLWPGY